MTDRPKGYRLWKVWDDGHGEHRQVFTHLPNNSFDFVYDHGDSGHIFKSVAEAERLAQISINIQTMLINKGLFRERFKKRYYVTPAWKHQPIARQRAISSTTLENIQKREKHYKSLRANITGYPRRKIILKG